jgi:pilus assembly protein Flp/PilA
VARRLQVMWRALRRRDLWYCVGISMIKIFKAFVADESGATAIEYGLIAAGISLAIISAVNGLGSKLTVKFAAINTSLK